MRIRRSRPGAFRRPSGSQFRCKRWPFSLGSEDRNDAGCAGSAEVLGEAKGVALELSRAAFAADLADHINNLRDAGCADGMPFALEAAARVDGQGSAQARGAGGGKGPALAA